MKDGNTKDSRSLELRNPTINNSITILQSWLSLPVFLIAPRLLQLSSFCLPRNPRNPLSIRSLKWDLGEMAGAAGKRRRFNEKGRLCRHTAHASWLRKIGSQSWVECRSEMTVLVVNSVKIFWNIKMFITRMSLTIVIFLYNWPSLVWNIPHL